MSKRSFFKPTRVTIISLIILVILFSYIPIIPCQRFPVVPNPTHTWTLCPLNPLAPSLRMLGVGHQYFGLKFDRGLLVLMLILTLVIPYILACFINKAIKKQISKK